VQRKGRENESTPEVKQDSAWRLLPYFIAVLVVDQVTKQLALAYLKLGLPVPVLGDFCRWTLTFNPGGAFGMKLGGTTYYLVSSIIIFIVLVWYIWRNRHISYIAIPLTIVLAGAAGNIIDRFRFGEVVDFIDCDFFNINIGSYHMDRWPIFNVADMAVSCGIIATILLILWYSRKDAQPSPTPSDSPEDTSDNSSSSREGP
jgi:signal peptidase II